jgi:hypothetical protein
MAKAPKFSTAGGSVAYSQVRSKFVKGKDGYGKKISTAREKLIAANGGKDPGKDVVAMHETFGSHKNGDGKVHWGTRAENTAESNKHRADVRKKKWNK